MAAQSTAVSIITVPEQGKQGRPRDHGQDLLEVQMIKQSSYDERRSKVKLGSQSAGWSLDQQCP